MTSSGSSIRLITQHVEAHTVSAVCVAHEEHHTGSMSYEVRLQTVGTETRWMHLPPRRSFASCHVGAIFTGVAWPRSALEPSLLAPVMAPAALTWITFWASYRLQALAD